MPDAGRVITGSAGGLRLAAPAAVTRPLSDRVKQALFGLLAAERADAWDVPLLDLYAGSGAAGIEALSRGCPAAVFVERDARAVAVIRRNLEHTGLARRGRVVRRDVDSFLAAGAREVEEAPFGIAVLDPPYAQVDPSLAALAALGDPALAWLDAEGRVVVKHFWRDAPPASIGGLLHVRRRRFGETMLSVYRRRAERTANATAGGRSA